jgi:hypothetical protein
MTIIISHRHQHTGRAFFAKVVSLITVAAISTPMRTASVWGIQTDCEECSEGLSKESTAVVEPVDVDDRSRPLEKLCNGGVFSHPCLFVFFANFLEIIACIYILLSLICRK